MAMELSYLSAAENSNQRLCFIYWCSDIWSPTGVHPRSPFVSAIHQWHLRGFIKFHYSPICRWYATLLRCWYSRPHGYAADRCWSCIWQDF